MANRKKKVYKPKPMAAGNRYLIQGLLQEYDIWSANDIQEALKDLLSWAIQDISSIAGMITGIRFLQFSNFSRRFALLFIPRMPLNR